MVWCPMKKSGMALMKCAELQKQFGCGSLRQLRIITTTKPENVPFFWPWLRRGRECPERANEKEVRELRLALSPLKSVEKSRKNPRTYRCPACGSRKAFGARQCPPLLASLREKMTSFGFKSFQTFKAFKPF